MLFGFINGLAGVILLNADKVFVNQYLSLDDVGIFGVCSLFAMFIRVPYNSLSKIATGIIAEAWKKDDHAKIKDIYQKSSLNQTIFGLLIFILIMVNLDNIFKILPPAYGSGKWVLIIYSAGMLVNTIVGLAGYITETSKHFRMISFYLLITIIVQIGLSMVLIPRFGINGAAFVTVFSLVLNASLQAGFQAYHFGIYGLSRGQLYVVGIGIISLAIGWFLPELPLVADVIFRSFVVTMVFMGLILGYKISAELNLLFVQTLKWFGKK
jgi:O-antigen/teichoic acid export membrane protein